MNSNEHQTTHRVDYYNRLGLTLFDIEQNLKHKISILTQILVD